MKNFFIPKTIAVVGASENEIKVGGILIKKLKSYKGKVIPINPNYELIQGLKAYKRISDYKDKIDLVVIAVPANIVCNVLEECADKKVKNVIIISAGFSEVGNAQEEERLIELAKKRGIRIIGPNCFGVCNPYSNLDGTFSKTMPDKGNIAFISQSGALWSFISDFSVGKFGFSGFVSLGNMSDLEFPDFVEYFSKDEKTETIVLYIEKLKDGRRFIEVCKKCKKKIYAVKAGSSSEGSRAAVSHTGSLATDFAIYHGAFKQAGVVLCDSLEEAFEKASGKTIINLKKSVKNENYPKRTFIITNAGGAGALTSDYLSNSGFEVKELPELKNPWDLIGTALASDYSAALEQIKDNEFYDSIVAILTPQSMSEINETASAIIDFSKNSKKKVVALFLGGQSVKEASKMFADNGVLCFNTLEEFKKSL